MSFITKIQDRIAREKLNRQRLEASKERLKEHEDIQKEREYQRRLKAIGGLTPEEKEFLERRKARLEAEHQKRKAQYESALKNVKKLIGYTGGRLQRPRKHKRRSSGFSLY